MPEELLEEKAKRIMDEACEKAAELLDASPRVAELILKQLLRCDPEHPAGMQLLGLAKYRMEQFTEAIEIFQTALEIDPYNADNHNDLGLAYAGLNQTDRAIASIQRAIELEPEHYLFLNNLALQYRISGNYEKALSTMKKAIEMCPDSPQMWTNYGGLFGEIKDIEGSIRCFEEALKHDPNYSASHVDLAYAHHLLGRWEIGFREYEWRFEYFSQMDFYKAAYDQTKRWNGEDSLEGKTILIYAEQGLGDAIQFARYLPELKARGARVVVHCPPTLDSLMKRCAGVDETVNRDIVNNRGDAFPDYDYQCAMMSLPHLLKYYDISGKPYIEPVTRNFREYIEEECGSDACKIGIVWGGSPAHPHDKRRSIPLKHFKPISEMESVKLFSLQFDTRPRKYGGFDMRSGTDGQVVNLAEGCEDMKITDLTTMIQSMEDTCTILAGLDLVIACDTAVVHLAGAMGVPCWVLIPYNPDWRWGIEGEATCWYNSVRIFRQPERGDWDSVFDQVRKELDAALLQD